ncbi:MAG: hypothetical protein ACFFB0_07765 [Promethearchaeota archaeon]
MNLKEILITVPVIGIIVGGYCALFTFLLFTLNNPNFFFTISTGLILTVGSICLIIVSKGIKKNPPLVASERSEVGITPLDCFTWGHLAFGIFSFLVELFFISFLAFVDGIILWWGVMQAIVLIAITWDIIENTAFIEFKIKFEDRRDSILNIFSDVFFVSLSGFLMIIVYLITQENFIITLIIGFIALVACGIIFSIRYRKVVLKREDYIKRK